MNRLRRYAPALLLALWPLTSCAPAGHEPGHSVEDTRAAVDFPPALKQHTLSNMRDHLQTLQRIQDAIGRGDFDAAAQLAESRLGMTSLALHGAHDVAKYMPQGMQEVGASMHKAASRFAIEASNAGATADTKRAVGALAEVTAQCVACHAAYRFQ